MQNTINLPVTFDGIDDKDMNARIDALHSLIERHVNTILLDTQHSTQMRDAANALYAKDGANLVVQANQAGVEIDRDAIEAQIYGLPKESKLNKPSDIHTKLEAVMAQRPKFQLSGLFGGNQKNRMDFLYQLKELGEALIALAEAQEAKAGTFLLAELSTAWLELQDKSELYQNMSTALSAGDTQAFFQVVEGDVFKALSSADRKAFLPVSTLLSVAQSAYNQDPKAEAVAVTRLLKALDSDSDATMLLVQAVKALPEDDERKARFTNYLLAHIGQFFPVFSNKEININTVASVGVYDAKDGQKTLRIRSAAGSDLNWSDTSPERAEAVLAAFSALPQFQAIYNNKLINANSVATVGIYDAKDGKMTLRIRTASGSDLNWDDTSAENAQSVLAAFSALPQFHAIFDNKLVNMNSVATVGIYDAKDGQKTLRIRSASGSDLNWSDTSPEQAKSVLAAFSALPQFHAIFDNKLVNMNSVATVGIYDAKEGKMTLRIRSAAGSDLNWSDTSPEQAEAVLAAFSALPQFHAIFDNKLVNMKSVATVGIYDAKDGQKTLRIRSAAGSDLNWSDTSPEQAEAVLAAFSALPQFHAIFDNKLVNMNSVATVGIYDAKDGKMTLRIRSTSGSDLNWSDTSPEQAQSVFASFSALPQFHGIFDNKLVNINSVASVGVYDANDGKMTLRIRSASGSDLNWSDTSPESAQAVFSDIRKLGQKRALRGLAGNAEDYTASLSAARAFHAANSNNSFSSNDSLLDYLPLMVAGYVLLSADDMQSPDIDVTPDLDMDANDLSDSDLSDSELGADFNDAADDGFDLDVDTGADFDVDVDVGGDTSFDSGFDSSSFDAGGSSFDFNS